MGRLLFIVDLVVVAAITLGVAYTLGTLLVRGFKKP
jgi:hypothetical protein